MNAEAARMVEARQEEVRRLGGLAAYRLHALQNLKLKVVVKESHATAVHALAFNHEDPACGNLFATVGRDQATVYDGEHMGGHLGVVAQLVNQPTQHAPGGELHALAWMSAAGWGDHHPAGDACLAVAGADANISVISVAESRVVSLLRGHTGEVVDLAAVPTKPGLLLSLARDGNVRLWHAPSEACLSSMQTDACCLAAGPDGNSLLIGTSKGRLFTYSIALAAASRAGGPVPGGFAAQQHSIDEGSRRAVRCQGSSHSEPIDCLRFFPGDRLATKSCDGRMHVWSLSKGSGGGGAGGSGCDDGWQLDVTSAWKVPNCHGGTSGQSRCRFGGTPDGRYIAAGNSKGDCYVFDAESGERVAHVSAIRVAAPVRACGLSDDCRHLLAVLGKGFIFRYEYQGVLPRQGLSADSSAEDGKENCNSAQEQQQE